MRIVARRDSIQSPVASTTTTEYVARNRRRFCAELETMIRFPSVSSDPEHKDDVERCGRWLAAHLSAIGLQPVEVVRTGGHSLVYGEWCRAPGHPTILIYGHYDVQPADPREWRVPPFSAVVADGFVYGRGASDDKGQLFAHVKAIEALLATNGRLPVNVKCLFEGEEEIGSTNLLPFLDRHRERLRADAAVMSDTRMLTADQPALTYAVRGQLAMELTVAGPGHDLHSGNFGGAVHDPLQALCEIIAQLHDPHGRIAVPGFYDTVRPASAGERRFLARFGPSDSTLLHETGAPRAWGERGFSVYERLTVRPALAITALHGGPGGSGPKAIIPSSATAKLSFRLVPNQDPATIERLVRSHLARIIPPTVRPTVTTHIRSRPALVDPTHRAMRSADLAYRQVFRRAPVWVRSGGTIPVVSAFQRVLGIPTVLMGFASPGDNLHGPNERFSLRNFERGILTSVAFLNGMAR
jgi:acetylornithine deacetylase/succinyl-diaminopimelate desuccinylase-like protein